MYRHSYALKLPGYEQSQFYDIAIIVIQLEVYFPLTVQIDPATAYLKGIWAVRFLPGCKQWVSTSFFCWFFTYCWSFASQFPSSKPDHQQSCCVHSLAKFREQTHFLHKEASKCEGEGGTSIERSQTRWFCTRYHITVITCCDISIQRAAGIGHFTCYVHTPVGIQFQKVGSRIIFAVRESDLRPNWPCKNTISLDSDSSDDMFMPPSKRDKCVSGKQLLESDKLLTEMQGLSKEIGQLFEVNKELPIPIGRKRTGCDTFRCCICQCTMVPPVMFGRCKSLIGC